MNWPSAVRGAHMKCYNMTFRRDMTVDSHTLHDSILYTTQCLPNAWKVDRVAS